MNQENAALTNGAASAAIVASAIGAAVMGALTAVSEVVASLRPMLAFYGPAGRSWKACSTASKISLAS